MKKYLILPLFLFVFAACGGGDEPPPPAETGDCPYCVVQSAQIVGD